MCGINLGGVGIYERDGLNRWKLFFFFPKIAFFFSSFLSHLGFVMHGRYHQQIS